MKFEKWQACGNDFIVLREEFWDYELEPNENRRRVRMLCSHHYGIGADGILLALPSEVADGKMVVYNRDGSEAEMCGNGIRCVAKMLVEETGRSALEIETLAGVKRVAQDGDYVGVEMGEPRILWEGEADFPKRRTCSATYLSVGNPHCVIYMSEVRPGELERFGPKLSRLPRFEEGANIEFVSLMTKCRLRVRVWERGVGRTLACGTGACASAYASYVRGIVKPNVTVTLDGGDVEIDIAKGGEVTMYGDARRTYKGEFDLRDIV